MENAIGLRYKFVNAKTTIAVVRIGTPSVHFLNRFTSIRKSNLKHLQKNFDPS